MELIRGRSIIAYHVHLKLEDFRIWNAELLDETLKVKPIDMATLFNKSHKEQQV